MAPSLLDDKEGGSHYEDGLISASLRGQLFSSDCMKARVVVSAGMGLLLLLVDLCFKKVTQNWSLSVSWKGKDTKAFSWAH